jgi:choline dehydrogenase-like flavoprotein
LNVTEQVGHNPISKGFVRAAQSIGIPFSHDFNGADQSGVGFYDVTQRNVRRESSATAYLGPARKRKNLVIETHAQATQLIIQNGRAIGVRYLSKDKPKEARVEAGGEVVVSGGAVNSPRLLLLSGIGLQTNCEAWRRDPTSQGRKELPDHMDVYLTAETAPVSYNGEDRWDKAARHGIQYLLYKTGPVTACVAEAGAFLCSSAGVRSPDIQIHCLPAYVVDHGRMRIKGHGVTINTCNLRPKSVGSVTLRSADPLAEPAIDPAFLQDPYDWKISMEASSGVARSSARPPSGPHQGGGCPDARSSRRTASAPISSSGRRPITTRSGRARWAALRQRSWIPSCGSAVSVVFGSSTPRSCRHSSAATPRPRRS